MEIIYESPDGRQLTQQDLLSTPANPEFEPLSPEQIAPEAKALHDKATAFSQGRQFNEALETLDQAARSQPDWPRPLYDIANIYMLAQEPEYALKFYRKTLDLAPRGYLTALQAAYFLTLEADGTFPAGLYRSYVALEWNPNPQEKAGMVQQLTQQYPAFGPAWKELAGMVPDNAQRLAVIEQGLAARNDPDTGGILRVNHAFTRGQMGQREEAVQQLGSIVLDPASSVVTEHFARLGLINLLSLR